MSGWLWAGLILYLLLVIPILVVGWLATRQLWRVQVAIVKHRASAGTWDDDAELYRIAGFEPTLPGVRPEFDPRFVRGKGQRG